MEKHLDRIRPYQYARVEKISDEAMEIELFDKYSNRAHIVSLTKQEAVDFAQFLVHMSTKNPNWGDSADIFTFDVERPAPEAKPKKLARRKTEKKKRT